MRFLPLSRPCLRVWLALSTCEWLWDRSSGRNRLTMSRCTHARTQRRRRQRPATLEERAWSRQEVYETQVGEVYTPPASLPAPRRAQRAGSYLSVSRPWGSTSLHTAEFADHYLWVSLARAAYDPRDLTIFRYLETRIGPFTVSEPFDAGDPKSARCILRIELAHSSRKWLGSPILPGRTRLSVNSANSPASVKGLRGWQLSLPS